MSTSSLPSTDWSSAAVSKALSFFPMDHPDAAVITARRVQHSRSKSNKDNWPDFTSFKNELPSAMFVPWHCLLHPHADA
jgi:hypothetical protein